MATIPENIKAVFDSTYVKIDTIEELEKLVDTPGTQLFKSDNTPITISKETHSDTKKGIFGFGKDVEVNIYKIEGLSDRSFSISSLLSYGVYRKPILTVLASPTTSGSLYLGASEADAMKEQAAVLDADVLKKLAFLRNSKTIFLYAKDVKKNTYSKVSISKDPDPNTPTTIYLNPMKPTSRAAEEERIKNYLKQQIATLTTHLGSVKGKTDASLEKTCAKLSSEGLCVLSKGKLQNNKDTVAKIIQAEIKTQNYNLGDGFDNYIKSALTYGEQIGLDKLKTKYLLVISTKPWVVSAQKAAAPAPPAAPEVTQVNVEGKVEPKKEERYLGLGGRRKTKRNDKKSRKGKSKKQAKSRKLFKGFMY
jgi:hypothetical protein